MVRRRKEPYNLFYFGGLHKVVVLHYAPMRKTGSEEETALLMNPISYNNFINKAII